MQEAEGLEAAEVDGGGAGKREERFHQFEDLEGRCGGGEDGLQLVCVDGEAGVVEEGDGLEAGGGWAAGCARGEGGVAVLVFFFLSCEWGEKLARG